MGRSRQAPDRDIGPPGRVVRVNAPDGRRIDVRTTWRIAAALLALAVPAAAATNAGAHDGARGGASPKRYTLTPDPAGNPEGIAYDARRGAFYVSITADGTIYRGTPGSATVEPFITDVTAKAAIGLEVRRGLLYVAGGPTGTIAVYDLATKEPVATFETGAGGFLNDLVVTGRGDVYVTDSFRPTLWHVTAAQVKAGGGMPQGIDLTGSIAYADGFNLNGIVARGESRLFAVQTNTGTLWRIRLGDGGRALRSVAAVDGVSLPGGDGMIVDRGRLVVVQGGPPARLTFVKLRGGDRGRIKGELTSALFNGPSTVARAGRRYLVVNADFANSATPFTVAGVPAGRGGHGHGHGGG
jgi:Cu-Zn family superoxide dismutase